MNYIKIIPPLLGFLASPLSLAAQTERWADSDEIAKRADVTYRVETQVSLSDGHTPLWLNANRHGLSSLDETNGYLRAMVAKPMANYSDRQWEWAYGVDVAVTEGYTSRLVLQQAYADLRWKSGLLSVGAKERPVELKNPLLSTGSQTLGQNARPVPQVRIELPDYWTIPALGRWLSVKGHIAYGAMTDQKWQHDFTDRQSKYADNVLYHSKAGYLKIGSEERFVPWSLELGLETASLFGGTSYKPGAGGEMIKVKNRSGLKSFLKAFVPSGGDVLEEGTIYENAEGDVLGSWVARLNYDAPTWRLSFYADKFFEDHSGMFLLDADGYGEGDKWDVREKTKFHLYDPKDWMLGIELELKNNRWFRHVVGEYLYSKYQSGSVYHDHSPGRPDQLAGLDDYYNHYIFTGWQHWGQVIGNPLYRSPIYNDDGEINVQNNRFVAWHLGIDGQPTSRLSYRAMATYQTGWGTYGNPYVDKRHNLSLMGQVSYQLPREWTVSAAVATDQGRLYHHNVGMQLTITKKGVLKHL